MQIEKVVDCTGCGACRSVCPVDAIVMQYDPSGFRYPHTDLTRCMDCGLCEKVCHLKKQSEPEKQRQQDDCAVYAAYLKETDELDSVSSGGVFWALAKRFIHENGVVYGVEQTSIFDVHHARAETTDQCKPFRRSKYLESRVDDVYAPVKQDLESGRLVLFSGVGCQISALRQYLGKAYEGLYTCEVICHGIPSMALYKLYIAELEKKQGSRVIGVNFRVKSNGWKKNHIAYSFEDGSELCEFCGTNAFHCGYTAGYYYRPSCAACRSAKLPRVADITLADFWRYQGKLLDSNPDRGISLVLCNTEKGKKAFSMIEDALCFEQSDMTGAIASCHHLTHAPDNSRYRDRFIEEALLHGFEKTFARYHKRDHARMKIKAIASIPLSAASKLKRAIKGMMK